MMNYQITVLSKWGQVLYRAGLKSRHIRAHGTPKELRKLHMACQNAELFLRMQEEDKRLFETVVAEPITAHGWRELIKLKGKMYPALQQFIKDANLYEWPTLVTAFVPTSTVPAEMLVDTQSIPTVEELFPESVHGE